MVHSCIFIESTSKATVEKRSKRKMPGEHTSPQRPHNFLLHQATSFHLLLAMLLLVVIIALLTLVDLTILLLVFTIALVGTFSLAFTMLAEESLKHTLENIVHQKQEALATFLFSRTRR
jgi:hypothetical protein